MDPSDHDLARAAADGSRDAGAELFRRHWPQARRIARAVVGRDALADDVAQEAMVVAFASIRRYRGDGEFAGWLRRIVVRRALNALRAERRLVPLDAAAEVAVDDTPVLADPALREAVAQLPDEQRIALALRYGAGLTPTEIAAATGLAVGTVNSRLGRALTRLRATLETHHV